MGFIDDAMTKIGETLVNVGETALDAGLSVWKQCSRVVLQYTTQDPTSMSAIWSNISGIYNMFLGVGASLMVFYFVVGWLNESIDIKRNFTTDALFRFFIRLSITAAALTNGMTFIMGCMRVSAVMAGQVGMIITDSYSADGIFDSLTEGLESGELMKIGILCMIAGLLGCAIIIVCGVSIILSVLSRFFKIFMCIPFDPPAIASFAGGRELSQSAAAWLKTFLAYCLEVVVIAMALMLAFSFFAGRAQFLPESSKGFGAVLIKLVNVFLPMVTAVSCVKGAEGILRRTLGL